MAKNKIRPSTLEWPGDWSIDTVGISQSLWSDWLCCRRMFLFKINGYAQPLKDEKVHFGNIVHYVNDKAYDSGKCPSKRAVGKLVDEYSDMVLKKGTVMTQQQMETDAAKAHATMTAYFEHYESDFTKKKFTGVEHLFEVRYNGCIQRGKIDGRYTTNRKKWLMEHKSKGRINDDTTLLRLPLDFQNLFYVLNDEIETGDRAYGVLYNVVRNTQMKQGKNESLKAYFERVLESCRADPDHSFKRWENTYTDEDMRLFQHDLDYMIDEIKFKTGLPIHCNRFNCDRAWQCEFLRACSEDSMASLTKSTEPQMDYIFPELKEVTNGSKQSKVDRRKRVAKRKVAKRKVAKRK